MRRAFRGCQGFKKPREQFSFESKANILQRFPTPGPFREKNISSQKSILKIGTRSLNPPIQFWARRPRVTNTCGPVRLSSLRHQRVLRRGSGARFAREKASSAYRNHHVSATQVTLKCLGRTFQRQGWVRRWAAIEAAEAARDQISGRQAADRPDVKPSTAATLDTRRLDWPTPGPCRPSPLPP